MLFHCILEISDQNKIVLKWNKIGGIPEIGQSQDRESVTLNVY